MPAGMTRLHGGVPVAAGGELNMRGSKKLCPRGSNFDNVFYFIFFFS